MNSNKNKDKGKDKNKNTNENKNAIYENENILIIEDKLPMKKILISALAKMKMLSIVVQDFNEAIDIIEQNDISLVIIDAELEGKNSFEFCKYLRKKYSLYQLPILFTASQAKSQYITFAYEFGCNDFITVPFNNAEFTAKIRTLVGIKKLAEQEKKLINLVETRTQVFKMNTHDLKNPLSSIFSLSGIPIDSFKDAEEISQTLNVVHDASKIMMSLVNQNLEYLNVSSGDIHFENTFVDVIGLISQIVEINRPLASEKKQQIIFDYSDADCFIYSDNSKIYRAINNIVSNAIKFSPLEKRIWIDVSKKVVTNKIIIIIKDEGPGFKKEEVDTVLVKFGKHSATPTGNEISTGLGLLISKQIINLSNGDIKLESEEGKGAKFTIEFNSINPDGLAY